MKCQFCEAEHDGDKVVVKDYLFEDDVYRACFDHAEEKFPVDERQRLDFDLPDGVEIISTEKRRSLENDVNRFHFVEQAILEAAKAHEVETGYRLTHVFGLIRRKLEKTIKRQGAALADYGIDSHCYEYVRSSAAYCVKCTNTMFHLDGYRIQDALPVAMHQEVKSCDVVVCLKCGHAYVGKLS